MSCKKIPDGVSQHKTAGPYSPVLEVEFNKLVLISGQAPIDIDGNVVGTTIEEQTEFTLKNCLNQLSKANCTFADVFKVNVYLTDLEYWLSISQNHDLLEQQYKQGSFTLFWLK